MAGRKNGKKELVQIDADWLLGESMDLPLPRRSRFPRIVLLLSFVVAAVWSWPYASRQWLQWDWKQQLSQPESKSSEDILPILLALNDLDPKHNESVIQQLASEDPEKRLVAYHLLQQRLERWSSANRPTPSELMALTNALQSMQTPPMESILLRGQLAARMLRLVGEDIPNASKMRGNIESMIASAGTASALRVTQERRPIPGESQPNTPDPRPPNQLLANQPTPSQPTWSVTSVRLGDGAPSNPAALPDPPSIRETQYLSRNATLAPTDPRTVSRMPLETTPKSWTATSGSVPAVSLPSPNLSTTQLSPSGTLHVSTPNDVVLSEKPTHESISGNLAYTSIRGIEKLPIEKLFPLLSSTLPKIVQEASKELVQRGMTTPQLEMAIDLAQGDIEQRTMAMDRLVRDQDLDPIPWLVWMAEQSDIKVRRKAVSLLGSMSNPNAIHTLRMLKLREPDSAILEQISQVLLAFGTTTNSYR